MLVGTHTYGMKMISVGTLVAKIGAIIIVPVLLLVPLGVFIDRMYGSVPFATVGALGISALISTFWIFRVVLAQSNTDEATDAL